MSSLANLFNWSSSQSNKVELPELFPMSVVQKDFVDIDVMNIYAKILTDVVERTEGISEDLLPSLWDNCLQSEHSEGLVTMLAKAMSDKTDLFLVYDRSVKLLRKATSDEQTQIKAQYKEGADSKVGTYISFKNYKRTDMVRLYSSLEYCAIASLNKNMNLAKAIQLKMSDMRGSVALSDSAQVESQALAIAQGLAQGKDVMIDVKDMIETGKPDVTATETSMDFINQRRSFYLGMPASYMTGLAPKGLGDSGEGDAKSVERGLKNYYFSIVKPVLESVFGIKVSFKSEDFRQMTSSLEALKTFELVSDELMSAENKLKVINKLFGFPEDTKGGEVPNEPQGGGGVVVPPQNEPA